MEREKAAAEAAAANPSSSSSSAVSALARARSNSRSKPLPRTPSPSSSHSPSPPLPADAPQASYPPIAAPSGSKCSFQACPSSHPLCVDQPSPNVLIQPRRVSISAPDGHHARPRAASLSSSATVSAPASSQPSSQPTSAQPSLHHSHSHSRSASPSISPAPSPTPSPTTSTSTPSSSTGAHAPHYANPLAVLRVRSMSVSSAPAPQAPSNTPAAPEVFSPAPLLLTSRTISHPHLAL